MHGVEADVVHLKRKGDREKGVEREKGTQPKEQVEQFTRARAASDTTTAVCCGD